MKSAIFFIAALAAATSTTPAMGLAQRQAAVQDNCQSHLGDCYSNGCNPTFAQPSDTTGTCTAGTYNSCPCEKCGGTSGSYTGSCTDNGCDCVQGVCTSGNYQGCTCD